MRPKQTWSRLHSVNANRDAVNERERLRVFREHGRERAGDNVTTRGSDAARPVRFFLFILLRCAGETMRPCAAVPPVGRGLPAAELSSPAASCASFHRRLDLDTPGFEECARRLDHEHKIIGGRSHLDRPHLVQQKGSG
jgi:hypothetical protein